MNLIILFLVLILLYFHYLFYKYKCKELYIMYITNFENITNDDKVKKIDKF